MGTSGAYGGSAGWSGVGKQTEEWLDGGAGVASAESDPQSSDESSQSHPSDQPTITPQLAALIRQLSRRLSTSGGGAGGSTGGGGIGGSGGASPGTRGRGRSTARASSVGGRAAAGVYGLRTGAAGPLGELGLSLDELSGLPKHEQAQRLLDAAMGPSGGVAESELRKASADLILWALSEDTEPAPIDLANRWVVEYVWQVWISEAGPVIRNHSANGYDSYRVEQEMRAALEATVAARGLSTDRPLTPRDFEQAINSALKSMERIGGTGQ